MNSIISKISKELKDASLLWIRSNQKILLSSREYEQLRIALNCNTDETDVIRSYGRMKYAKIPDKTKAPILLSREHRLSFLVVLYSHMRVLNNLE